MSVTKTVQYSGSVDNGTLADDNFLAMSWETEVVINGNQRTVQRTGGVVATATFDVAGELHRVQATIPAAQVAGKTVGALVQSAQALLAVELGL